MAEPDERRADPSQELVDVVDGSGRIVDVVPRWRMRQEGLPHRATYVVQLLVNPEPSSLSPGAVGVEYEAGVESWFAGVDWNKKPKPFDGPGPRLTDLATIRTDTNVVVHQRADWKDVNPGYWDLGFGGVCSAGEPWLPSARRELEEEAGIGDVVVVPIGAGRFSDRFGTIFGALFAALTTNRPSPNDGEVVAIDHVEAGDLGEWCRDRPVCADSVALILPMVDGFLATSGNG